MKNGRAERIARKLACRYYQGVHDGRLIAAGVQPGGPRRTVDQKIKRLADLHWRKFISEYNDALIIGFNADANNFLRSLKKVNKILIKLEREAFMLDLPKAFVLFAGSCMLCKKCVIHEKDFPKNIDPRIARRFCKHLRKARPSMEGIGIDVFATLAKVGIKLHVLDISNFDKFRQFGLLLLD